ncbi:MAG TPA: carbamoylphosphate synthase large subunit [Firmicutes bacterium]|nr:carbamoylphosphate synthase large subunit [Bacillota bacterium]
MNFVFVSPNFPKIYSHFVKALSQRGITVLGIGDTPKEQINDELKNYLTEYCFVSDLSNLIWMKNTLDYLENKYGEISYIESNNEYWLMSDSKLREYKKVKNGFYPKDMDKIKYKSKMKEYFNKAGVKTARYTLSENLNELKDFAQEVGYPLFAKPDNGVGASDTFKIKDETDLITFLKNKPSEQYIIEEYINGEITTFDGIVDDNSTPLLMYNESFPIPVANVVNDDIDDFYYANMDMDPSFRKMGIKVVKAFEIKKRCFHIEFFRLLEDKVGLGKKGDILGLEVNMRSPGGDTPELLSIALDDSYYECYADIIAYNKINKDLNKKHFIAISVSRKNHFKYIHSLEEINKNYKDFLVEHGYYDKAIALCMGDEYFMAKFDNVNDALSFKDFVMAKY